MADLTETILTGILTGLAADAVWESGKWTWKHREKLADWYYIAGYQLTKPFKPPPKTTATLTVQVVGRFRSRLNPYTGEYITSRVDFDKE